MADEGFGEALTVDQLRVLVAVVDTGTFSAAARQLGRAQGAISYNIAQLEAQLELDLFERSGRRRKLTAAGSAVVDHARAVLAEVDRLRANARGMGEGLEAQLTVAVDALFPMSVVIDLVRGFRDVYPAVPLSLRTGVLGEVLDELESGAASVGISGLSTIPRQFAQRPIGEIELVPVVGPRHPLAQRPGVISDAELARHVHIVIRDRSTRPVGEATGGLDSSRNWSVDDSHARHALVQAGLGWSRLPLHQIRAELSTGELVEIRPRRWAGRTFAAGMTALYRKGEPPGPAGRWWLEQLAATDHEDLCLRTPKRSRRKPR